MNITEIHGNIFTTQCGVLVNTVNCVGVMGAGIALECRYRFPGLFDRYVEVCDARQLEPGKLWIFNDSKPRILCFPTKRHWKDPSRIEFIDQGLRKFAATYEDRGVRSIAMPHLGCSHGGLDWEREVRPIVVDHLSELPGLVVEVYSFDPAAKDPFFDQLAAPLRKLDAAGIAVAVGVRKAQAGKIHEVMQAGDVSTMLGLQSVKGLGEKSLVKLYEFGRSQRDNPGPGQMSLALE